MDNLYQNLYKLWAAGNDAKSPLASSAATTAPLTSYQKAQIEHQNAVLAQNKIEEENKIRLQQMKMRETSLYHKDQAQDRKYKIALDLQAKVAAYQKSQEDARRNYVAMFVKDRERQLSEWSKLQISANQKGSGYSSAAKMVANVNANFASIVSKAPFAGRQLSPRQIEAKLNQQDIALRASLMPGLDAAHRQALINKIEEFNSLSPEDSKRAQMIADAQKISTDYSNIGETTEVDQAKKAEMEQFFLRNRPKLATEDPEAAINWANEMANKELGPNPYAAMIKSQYLPQEKAQEQEKETPTAQIGGYFSGSRGSYAIPAEGQTASQTKLIDDYNRSAAAKRPIDGTNLTMEDMAKRVSEYTRNK